MAEKKVFDILPPQGAEKEETEETLSRISLPKTPLSKSLLLCLALIILGLIFYFTLGEAKIEIWPELTPLSFQEKITVDKSAGDVSLEQKVIPGAIFDKTVIISEEFLSSGKKTLEKKAEGTIRVYNNSSIAQTLIQNTRFQPPSEKFQPSLEKNENPWFRSQVRIVISPKSLKDVRVVADAPGEKYNIKPSQFSIPGLVGSSQYTLVYGESFGPFSGGEKKKVSQVSSEDLQSAKDALIRKAEAQGLQDLQNKAFQDNIVLPDSFKTEVLEDSSQVQAGAEAERFDYKVVVKSSALAFTKEDLDKFIDRFLSSEIPEGKKAAAGSFKKEYTLFSVDKELNKMIVSLNLEAKTYFPLEETSLKNGLLGKGLGEAKLLLEKQEGVQKIKIKLWPFWLKSIPKDLQKVKIELHLD